MSQVMQVTSRSWKKQENRFSFRFFRRNVAADTLGFTLRQNMCCCCCCLVGNEYTILITFPKSELISE